jgi:hypothetical protein
MSNFPRLYPPTHNSSRNTAINVDIARIIDLTNMNKTWMVPLIERLVSGLRIFGNKKIIHLVIGHYALHTASDSHKEPLGSLEALDLGHSGMLRVWNIH